MNENNKIENKIDNSVNRGYPLFELQHDVIRDEKLLDIRCSCGCPEEVSGLHPDEKIVKLLVRKDKTVTIRGIIKYTHLFRFMNLKQWKQGRRIRLNCRSYIRDRDSDNADNARSESNAVESKSPSNKQNTIMSNIAVVSSEKKKEVINENIAKSIAGQNMIVSLLARGYNHKREKREKKMLEHQLRKKGAISIDNIPINEIVMQ